MQLQENLSRLKIITPINVHDFTQNIITTIKMSNIYFLKRYIEIYSLEKC